MVYHWDSLPARGCLLVCIDMESPHSRDWTNFAQVIIMTGWQKFLRRSSFCNNSHIPIWFLTDMCGWKVWKPQVSLPSYTGVIGFAN